MKKSNIETIQNQVNEILTAARQEADNLQAQVDAANKAQEAATAAFMAAQQGDNPQEYAEAAANQRACKDILQMYTDKKKALSAKALITIDTRREMKAQTVAALDDLNQEAKEKLIKIMADLKAMKDEIGPVIQQGSNLLSQIDLLHSPMEKPQAAYSFRGKDGGAINLVTLVDTILDHSSVKYLKEDN